MTSLMRAVGMASDLLKEQDFRTSMQQRWWSEQLTASPMLVCPRAYASNLRSGY